MTVWGFCGSPITERPSSIDMHGAKRTSKNLSTDAYRNSLPQSSMGPRTLTLEYCVVLYTGVRNLQVLHGRVSFFHHVHKDARSKVRSYWSRRWLLMRAVIFYHRVLWALGRSFSGLYFLTPVLVLSFVNVLFIFFITLHTLYVLYCIDYKRCFMLLLITPTMLIHKRYPTLRMNVISLCISF